MRRRTALCTLLTLSACALVAAFSIAAPPTDEANPVEVTPVETTEPTLPTADEARGRARLLHETIHSTLQVVHHQYYREDEGLMIPAATMKRVFAELAKRQKVEVRWLAVDGQVMNSDHDPQDDFEKQAVAALASGKPEFDQSTNGVYRRAGPITLGSDCLKCHLPNRTSTEDRLAGLVITMKTRAP